MLMITDRIKIETFDALLCEVVGGPEIVEMLTRHHADGTPFRTLADEHDIPLATLHGRIKRARNTLRRLRLMPQQWEKTRCH